MYCYVYVIGKEKNLVEPYNECYIGVTANPKRRWKSHTKSKYKIGNFIRNNNLTFDVNLKIIFEGDKSECFLMETEYRPIPNLGLNQASGGCGGYTSYLPERNKKISLANKNKIVSEETKKKMSESIKERGSFKADKNPNSSHWILRNKKNEVINIKGNLQKFCNDNKLLRATLRYYIGKRVPPISNNSCGGFREKFKGHKKMRENTTGWLLEKGGY